MTPSITTTTVSNHAAYTHIPASGITSVRFSNIATIGTAIMSACVYLGTVPVAQIYSGSKNGHYTVVVNPSTHNSVARAIVKALFA